MGADQPSGPPPVGPQSGAVMVLNSNTLWRQFVVSRCAFARTPDGELEPWDSTPLAPTPVWCGVRPKPAVSTESPPLPPADWAGPDMDDRAWPRVRLPQPPSTPPAESYRPQTKYGATATLLVRGKFEVKDPGRVKACRLWPDYLGGVVVYARTLAHAAMSWAPVRPTSRSSGQSAVCKRAATRPSWTGSPSGDMPGAEEDAKLMDLTGEVAKEVEKSAK